MSAHSLESGTNWEGNRPPQSETIINKSVVLVTEKLPLRVIPKIIFASPVVHTLPSNLNLDGYDDEHQVSEQNHDW